MDINKAYKVLDISPKATIEEVEERFYLWNRRYKSQLDRNIQQNLININEITEAYKMIIEHLDQESVQSTDGNSPKSPLKEKMDHILYYHKFHIIAGIIGFILLIAIITSSINAWQDRRYLESLPPADLSITFYGEFRGIRMETLEENILDLFPEWQRVTVNLITSPIEVTNEFNIGEQQRSAIDLMQDTSDLYITDFYHFDVLMEQGLFSPFSPIEDFLEDHLEEEKRLYRMGQTDQETDKEIIGIDITSHEIFANTEVTPINKNIIALHTRSEDTENALRFVKKIIEDFAQENEDL
ncbi:hypothetical protein [Evansella tamaricis]|uniref:J domain-containing protein n=1 Tax=Evansella tamaricis TaxID=2069301 RepID=A0ABS6JIV1_9BACI|nr:hypothetical protein [Evansella tamaricis]MBU9713577.1 hypothetical protein [Evansella tamaricis]